MKCLVLLKEVPNVASIRIDPETFTVDRDNVINILDPADLNAIEAALTVASGPDDETVAMSMGPESADAVIRTAIAMGIKKGVRITDDAFAGADSLVTATVLKAAIDKEGPFDVIFCGAHSVDGATGQIAGKLGAMLGIGTLTRASKIDTEDGGLRIQRKAGGGYEELSASFPLICSVTEDLNKPRKQTMKGKSAAKKAVIEVLTNGELAIPADQLVSPSRVVALFPPMRKEGGEELTGSTDIEKADNLVDVLMNNHLI
ncbi:MAG: electron transfer flavoprotein subunit beta/FixA family protein [Lachnospiraceae bacterium]|jgi:electron transfer flavoprotein beta subunit